MPTKPLETILWREMSIVEARDAIQVVTPLLQELVNYATNALARCADSAPKNPDENSAILALYRNIIEATDGIEVLLSQSCTASSVPLLRTSFEALLAIEYIVEDRSKYIQRSLAWLVSYAHNRLDSIESLDPSTKKGMQAKALFEADPITSLASILPPQDMVQKSETLLRTFLRAPHIQPIEAEYIKTRPKKWCQLFGGPSNLRALAEELNYGGRYQILYRQWSTIAHAEDFFTFIETRNGTPTIARLRDPRKVAEMAGFAASFLLEATRKILLQLRPGEEASFATWYKQEVQERYRKLYPNARL